MSWLHPRTGPTEKRGDISMRYGFFSKRLEKCRKQKKEDTEIMTGKPAVSVSCEDPWARPPSKRMEGFRARMKGENGWITLPITKSMRMRHAAQRK